jgi:abortive infection bacteriophage resistance protein
MTKKKPWLTPSQQVEHLKSKGVKFELYSEEEAEDYLRENNNYFRIRSYRTNFDKRVGGPNAGKYIGLDFGMLVDMSIIDMHLRDCMLPMTLDIEHFAKMRLLGQIELNGEDGYQIVQDFLRDQAEAESDIEANPVIKEIRRGSSNPYTRGLVASRPIYDYPAWEFMEVISFGRFIHFQRFCAKRFNDKKLLDGFYALKGVKQLRNACAHDNCIINDMRSGDPSHEVPRTITKALGQIDIGKSMRQTKLSNERLQHIATTLYVHQAVASEGMKNNRAKSLYKLADRMKRNEDYYAPNSPISTGFDFITRMIKGWY